MTVLPFIAALITTLSPLFNVGGGLTLTALFATDRVLTRGQHLRRVADIVSYWEKTVNDLKDYQAATLAELVKHHTEVVAERDARYVELKATLASVDEARKDEQTQRIALSEQLSAGYNSFGKLAADLLTAIDKAPKE